MLEKKKGYWNIASAWTREFPVWSFMSVEKINWKKKKLPNNNQNDREAELMKKKILPWYTLHIRYIPFFIKCINCFIVLFFFLFPEQLLCTSSKEADGDWENDILEMLKVHYVLISKTGY